MAEWPDQGKPEDKPVDWSSNPNANRRLMGLPLAGDAVVTQIPPAPMSDEDLRLEALSLAVRLRAGNPRSNYLDVKHLANQFIEYIRPE